MARRWEGSSRDGSNAVPSHVYNRAPVGRPGESQCGIPENHHFLGTQSPSGWRGRCGCWRGRAGDASMSTIFFFAPRVQARAGRANNTTGKLFLFFFTAKGPFVMTSRYACPRTRLYHHLTDAEMFDRCGTGVRLMMCQCGADVVPMWC